MKKTIAILVLVLGGLWVAFYILGPQAPLKDGLYLSYDCGGSTIRVTFNEIEKGQFRATLSSGNSEEVVNRKLRTSGGRVYEVGLLGPLWIPPNSVKVGGSAHGSRVVEVKRWKKWDVGVIKASVGFGGALRGTWYYEKNTGFLVGGSKTSAVSGEGEGAHFVLKESNLENL